MNRQQRRLAARHARARAEIRAQHQAEQEIYYARLDSVYLEQSYTVVALALNELYGFGQKRIAKVWNRMNEMLYSIGESEEEYMKLRARVNDELGMHISWTKE